MTRGGGKVATQQRRMPEGWLAAIEESGSALDEMTPISRDASLEEMLMMGLRLTEGIPRVRLEALAQRPGVVKSRNQLLDIAYQDDVYVDDRTIDSHIKRIRRKFRVVDPEFDAIETLYGVGYRFDDQ